MTRIAKLNFFTSHFQPYFMILNWIYNSSTGRSLWCPATKRCCSNARCRLSHLHWIFSCNPSRFRVLHNALYPLIIPHLTCQSTLYLVACALNPFLPVFTFFCKTTLAWNTCSWMMRPATLVLGSHYFSMGVLPSYVHTSPLARLLQATPVVHGFKFFQILNRTCPSVPNRNCIGS